jgi:hypothetical protein
MGRKTCCLCGDVNVATGKPFYRSFSKKKKLECGVIILGGTSTYPIYQAEGLKAVSLMW